MNNREELRSILLKHHALYPKMQVRDMVKLIYQNEFGGEHLIVSEDACLKHLTEEINSLKKSCSSNTVPALFEEIGNGLCRISLEAVKDSGISIPTLNRFFTSTAGSIKGSMESFEQKLEVLRQCCLDKSLPYSAEEVEDYINEYRRQGYPPVSHSPDYRAFYSPAYRIVRVEYAYYFEVFRRIDRLLNMESRILAAIDGNCSAGKTTLATRIGDIYDCNIFHMDHFFLRPELRKKERFEEAGGNVDYERFRDEVINGIKSGREFSYQVFNCKKMALDEHIYVQPKKLNIIEGAYSMHPTLIGNYSLKVFLSIGENEQRDRILRRNGEAVLRQFQNRWIPLENKYFAELKIAEKCDLVYQGNTLVFNNLPDKL